MSRAVAPSVDVHEKLYLEAGAERRAREERVRRARQRARRSAERPKASAKSREMLREREERALSDLFDLLRRGAADTPPETDKQSDVCAAGGPAAPQEGALLDCASASAAVLKERRALRRVVERVLSKAEGQKCTRADFVRRMRAALVEARGQSEAPVASMLAKRKDAAAARDARRKEEREATHRPKIDGRSAALAAMRGRGGGRRVEDVLLDEAEEYERRAAARRLAEEQRRMRECTFRPRLESGCAARAEHARYPNEREEEAAAAAALPGGLAEAIAAAQRGAEDEVAGT